MSNELRVFESPEFGKVRITFINNECWFVAQDILINLGYRDTRPAKVMQCVPDEWKGMKPFHTLGGTQNLLCLSEAGLYFFLGRSDKPKAIPYQKWVAGEVIPSIRKNGYYSMGPQPELKIIADPLNEVETMCRDFISARDKVRTMAADLRITLNEIHEAQKPKRRSTPGIVLKPNNNDKTE